MSIKNEYLGFINSKPLWKNKTLFNLSQFNIEELFETDISPNTLEINIRDNEVLGKRIEHYFEYCIINSDHYEVIAKNIQIYQDKITIGELDFLIKDHRDNKTLHIEIVYKFYLHDPSIEGELQQWIGPNRKDTLLQKIEKLKTKQLPLLYRSETLPILKNLQINSKSIHQKVSYMANLFVPVSMKNKLFPIVNNQCIVGFWVTSEAFTSEQYGTYHFNIPKKKDWATDPKYCDTWFSFNDITEKVQVSLSQKKSPLLWMKSNGDSYDRFFIVWW
ncbi:hypothetical protein ATE84_2465 [Aquimarina sp. MAR_2010_214]|uniref:DUF1853 family protein n=1 Tax=Aquimarina sp. MAR_2010_214 TaxID=1250026 RepID=UPI000C702BBC|nr:DUF1853 family protein [Aquimarina sp. MAR_2010_214]PKV50408.1 hypothetical protein ATE84_2465 [Aquimarina sp. MAR_2010_214]